MRQINIDSENPSNDKLYFGLRYNYVNPKGKPVIYEIDMKDAIEISLIAILAEGWGIMNSTYDDLILKGLSREDAQCMFGCDVLYANDSMMGYGTLSSAKSVLDFVKEHTQSNSMK